MSNRLNLRRMAEFIRLRQLSPSELVNAHLRQIERVNPSINAMVEVYAEQARRQAREAEQALLRQEPLGPLHGVPVTVKDSFGVAGSPLACGSRLRTKEIQDDDSTAVARLKQAGAILLGRTNCPEFLMNYETDNHLTGATRNPWNPEWTAGGSSGGEAAAIASFCSPGGMGSDGGGSIREPAHFCGIAGLKPTPGRVPAYGHWPVIDYPVGFMGVVGPMARNVADVAQIFAVVEGFDPRDPFSAPVQAAAIPERVAVAVLEQWPGVPVETGVRQAVRDAARHLESTGSLIDEFDASFAEEAPLLWEFIFTRYLAALLWPGLRDVEDQCHWTGSELIQPFRDAAPPTPVELEEVLAKRGRIRSQMLTRMQTSPVLLLPACGVTAFPSRQRLFETPAGRISLLQAMAVLTPWNLLGFPALTVPMGLTAEGKPAGVQLVGAPYSEELLLDVGRRLEEARGPLPLPPIPGL